MARVAADELGWAVVVAAGTGVAAGAGERGGEEEEWSAILEMKKVFSTYDILDEVN